MLLQEDNIARHNVDVRNSTSERNDLNRISHEEEIERSETAQSNTGKKHAKCCCFCNKNTCY